MLLEPFNHRNIYFKFNFFVSDLIFVLFFTLVWKREIVSRKESTRKDVYYVSPNNTKLSSRNDAIRYCKYSYIGCYLMFIVLKCFIVLMEKGNCYPEERR